ncbi:bifunctional molybdenum cofactor biosynthesis protein MoaC/MoaB [soil metagenome]
MINVSGKISTLRLAKAGGSLKTNTEVIQRVINKDIPKGDVLEVSRVAGINAAKKTSELLIFCHNLPLEWVDIFYKIEGDTIHVVAEAEAIARTGVEMEALTAVSTTLLNMYDMLKPLDKEMEISSIRLLEKTGGKSDFKEDFDHPVKAALLRVSDEIVEGTRTDNSTEPVKNILTSHNVKVEFSDTLGSDADNLRDVISNLADSNQYHIVFTIGATGLEHEDVVAEVTEVLIDFPIPGIAEAMREFGRNRTPYANYSRTTAGVRGETLIINLPGSSRGASESIQALFPGLKHALRMMNKGKLRKIE